MNAANLFIHTIDGNTHLAGKITGKDILEVECAFDHICGDIVQANWFAFREKEVIKKILTKHIVTIELRMIYNDPDVIC